MGVRFISVNDHYDSEDSHQKTIGMNLAFKTLVNDLYSKDLSVKVKSSLTSKKERGIYCSGNCPFGYRKKADDRNQVEVVEEEAEVVREIFRLTLEGYTSVEIAKKFNQESIKTPAEYLIARGATHRKPVGKEFSWQHSVICNILKNDFYVGDVVYGKYEKDSVGGKKHLKPRSEWKITYNHHEPIIEREIFEAVRETRGKTKPYIAKRSHVLQGKVVCEECGKALRYRNSKNPYFYCNERYVTGNEKCVYQVNVFFLEQIILSALQKEIQEHIIWKECKFNELNQEVADIFIKKVKVWDEQHLEIIWNFRYSY